MNVIKVLCPLIQWWWVMRLVFHLTIYHILHLWFSYVLEKFNTHTKVICTNVWIFFNKTWNCWYKSIISVAGFTGSISPLPKSLNQSVRCSFTAAQEISYSAVWILTLPAWMDTWRYIRYLSLLSPVCTFRIYFHFKSDLAVMSFCVMTAYGVKDYTLLASPDCQTFFFVFKLLSYGWVLY